MITDPLDLVTYFIKRFGWIRGGLLTLVVFGAPIAVVAAIIQGAP